MNRLVTTAIAAAAFTSLTGPLSAGDPPPTIERVALAQFCFWTGERTIGAMAGVVRTEAGFFDGHEVTLVDFDSDKTSLAKIIRAAREADVADGIYVTTAEQATAARSAGIRNPGRLGSAYRAAPASDQKRQLPGTAFAQLDLTPEQATKVNAFARTDPKQALAYLTPAQRERLAP